MCGAPCADSLKLRTAMPHEPKVKLKVAISGHRGFNLFQTYDSRARFAPQRPLRSGNRHLIRSHAKENDTVQLDVCKLIQTEFRRDPAATWLVRYAGSSRAA